MDEEWKAKWVTALRSGEYRKGTGRLRFRSRFCCLGVLCDLVKPDDWLKDRHLGCRTMPGVEVLSITGLDSELAGELAIWNDEGVTFSRLADIIDKDA